MLNNMFSYTYIYLYFNYLQAPQLSDKALLNETINIYYGTNGTRTALEDNYEHYGISMLFQLK